jgi:hypothetical protein
MTTNATGSRPQAPIKRDFLSQKVLSGIKERRDFLNVMSAGAHPHRVNHATEASQNQGSNTGRKLLGPSLCRLNAETQLTY